MTRSRSSSPATVTSLRVGTSRNPSAHLSKVDRKLSIISFEYTDASYSMSIRNPSFIGYTCTVRGFFTSFISICESRTLSSSSIPW